MKRKFVKKFASLILACVATFAIVLPTGGCDFINNIINPAPQAVDFTQLTYVAFGDSITYGEVGSTGKKMDMPYPELVAEELQFKAVQNKGVRGATVKVPSVASDKPNILSQVLEASAKADIVSVMIGINDFGAGYVLGTAEDTDPSVSVYGAYNYLADLLSEKYPDAFIFFMTPLKPFNWAETNSAGYTLVDMSNAVKTVCEANGFAVLDLYATSGFSPEVDLGCSDGLHPSQRFFEEYMAPQIVEFIRENYGK